MSDLSKFEKMLELLINEDKEAAEELFHEIVVSRSREIYENILENEDDDLEETEDDNDDENVDESDSDEDENLDENDNDEDLDEFHDLDEFSLGGDPTDNMMSTIGSDDDGDEDDGMDADDDMGMDVDMDSGAEGDDEVTDYLVDIKDELEALKAEFEKFTSSDSDDDFEGDDDSDDEFDMGADDDSDDVDMDATDDEEETEEHFAYESKNKTRKTASEEMREYVEKVSGGGLDAQKIGGDNGSNTKSTVASKNDMGGTTANIARTDTENSGEAGKGQIKGSSVHKQGKKEDNAGNINVPGGKAGKTSFKKTEPGHGAEKKGKPETADKGAHSTIKGVVRNK